MLGAGFLGFELAAHLGGGLRQDAVVDGEEGQLQAVADAGLVVDRAQVVLDDLLGGLEAGGDLAVFADAFEPFHPDRIVSRILGMGDMMSLIEKAESSLDRKKSDELAKKALLGYGFTLEDFRDQLQQIKKLGSMESILKMLPSVGPFAGLQQASKNVDEKQFTRLEAIINSMTPKERRNHDIINGTRRKRIANGSGTTVQDVNQLLRQYAQMAKMFKQMGKGGLAPR